MFHVFIQVTDPKAKPAPAVVVTPSTTGTPATTGGKVNGTKPVSANPKESK